MSARTPRRHDLAVNEELRYVLLGALISVPLSVISPFITDWMKRRLATRSRSARTRRVAELELELAKLERWNRNRSLFHSYLISRLILAFVIENLVAIFTSAIGAGNSSIWATWRASNQQTESPLVLADWTNAATSALWFVSSIVMFRILFTAYKAYKSVTNIDSMRSVLESQIALLSNSKEPGAPATGSDAVTGPADERPYQDVR